MRWRWILVPLLLAGCVASPSATDTAAEAPASASRSILLNYDLSVSETQNQVGGFGLGVDEPDCASIQGDPVGTIERASASVTWQATAPSHGELYVEFLTDPRLPARVSAEGASPLTLAIPGPFEIGDEGSTYYVFQAYIGAPRGTSLVAKQPVHLELTLEVAGDVRDYLSSCTVAG